MNGETYIEIVFKIADTEYREMIMAELALNGYDPIIETEEGLICHSLPDIFSPEILDEVSEHYSEYTSVSWESRNQPTKNWNEEWEKSYQPVEVENCRIRADFHPFDPSFEIDLVINPEMSFGTGHHDTTAGMIRLMLKYPFHDSTVIDAGTGSGVLAILASKLGATSIVAFDIEPHVVENANQNASKNNSNIKLYCGSVAELKHLPEADYFLANINRNVLIDEFPYYHQYTKPGGLLFLSGFYDADLPLIENALEKNGFRKVRSETSEQQWVTLVAQKVA